jgi:hypothetical protein
MTPAEVLALARARGVQVFAGTGGRLRWRCTGPLPGDLRKLLADHKVGVLALLPTWDETEAARLLTRVRAAADHVEVECRAGRTTEAQRNAVAVWLEVAEGYVAGHEAEAARGWDALELLRRVATHAKALAVRPQHQRRRRRTER